MNGERDWGQSLRKGDSGRARGKQKCEREKRELSRREERGSESVMTGCC